MSDPITPAVAAAWTILDSIDDESKARLDAWLKQHEGEQ